jgi:hypothetical protein
MEFGILGPKICRTLLILVHIRSIQPLLCTRLEHKRSESCCLLEKIF